MISGGRIDNWCSQVRNTPLRVEDFNFDGQLDQLNDEQCKSSKKPTSNVWLDMGIADHERLPIGHILGTSAPHLTGFLLWGDWKLKMGAAKEAPLFTVGDKVATPLGEEGQIYGFEIYFDPNFNVVQRVAEIRNENNEVVEFDLGELALLSSISDLDLVAAEITESTKTHFGEELRRYREILEIADYHCLKGKTRAEVDTLKLSIFSYVASYIEEPAINRDELSQRYLWERVKEGLDFPLQRPASLIALGPG